MHLQNTYHAARPYYIPEMVLLMVKHGHSWETQHSTPGVNEGTVVDPEIQAVADQAVVGWETIGQKNFPRPTGDFEWNLKKPGGTGSPFFNTVVSHGILQALKGTLVGNVISYFACILASVFGSMEKVLGMLKEIVRDIRIFVDQFQLGIPKSKIKHVKVKAIPTKFIRPAASKQGGNNNEKCKETSNYIENVKIKQI